MARRPKTRNPNKRRVPAAFRELMVLLAELGQSFYARGWVLGTSGNFSAVVSRNPFQMAITSTGVDKSHLTPSEFVLVDGHGKNLRGSGQPSAETGLHLAVVRSRHAGAVLHTHSVWSTILSDLFAGPGGLRIGGYEMLKGLEGIKTHTHQEWLPILENSQDASLLASSVEETLTRDSHAHGFLLRRHGLYTWGDDVLQAKRHVEILEFLLEAIWRTCYARVKP